MKAAFVVRSMDGARIPAHRVPGDPRQLCGSQPPSPCAKIRVRRWFNIFVERAKVSTTVAVVEAGAFVCRCYEVVDTTYEGHGR